MYLTTDKADPHIETAGRSGRYVLIIKWDAFRAAVLQRCVAEAIPSCQTVVCHSGEHALRQMRVCPAWMALLGLALPDTDGLDLLDVMQREYLARRILVVTGRHDERSQTVLRSSG